MAREELHGNERGVELRGIGRVMAAVLLVLAWPVPAAAAQPGPRVEVRGAPDLVELEREVNPGCLMSRMPRERHDPARAQRAEKPGALKDAGSERASLHERSHSIPPGAKLINHTAGG